MSTAVLPTTPAAEAASAASMAPGLVMAAAWIYGSEGLGHMGHHAQCGAAAARAYCALCVASAGYHASRALRAPRALQLLLLGLDCGMQALLTLLHVRMAHTTPVLCAAGAAYALAGGWACWRALQLESHNFGTPQYTLPLCAIA
jgi:hypothetical protein